MTEPLLAVAIGAVLVAIAWIDWRRWQARREVNPYLRHDACRGPVVRVRSAVTGVVLAGLCPRCGEQTPAREAVLWGEDR